MYAHVVLEQLGVVRPGRTTDTATSKAGAGLAQRVARNMSIASRFYRSALETLYTALDHPVERLPTHAPVSHLASAEVYAKARAHQTRAVPPEPSSQTTARTPSCRRRPQGTLRPSHPRTLRSKTRWEDNAGVNLALQRKEAHSKESLEDLDPCFQRHRWTHARVPRAGWRSHCRPNVAVFSFFFFVFTVRFERDFPVMAELANTPE